MASSLLVLEWLISVLFLEWKYTLYVYLNCHKQILLNSLTQDTHDTSLLHFLFLSIVRQFFKKMHHGVRSNMVRLFFILWFCSVKNYFPFSLLGLLSFWSWFLLGFLPWHEIWLLRVGKQWNSGFWQKLRGQSFPGWHQEEKTNTNHWL